MKNKYNNTAIRELNKPVEILGARPITLLVGFSVAILLFFLSWVLFVIMFIATIGVAMYEKAELKKGNSEAVSDLLNQGSTKEYLEDDGVIQLMMEKDVE
jgi:hypothetical protein